jgi:hypothetical protein
MIQLSTNSQAYANARLWYSSNCVVSGTGYHGTTFGDLKSYEQTVVQPFHVWLADQGCQIGRNQLTRVMFGVDSYEVAVGQDQMEFECDIDLTAFLLRWS